MFFNTSIFLLIKQGLFDNTFGFGYCRIVDALEPTTIDNRQPIQHQQLKELRRSHRPPNHDTTWKRRGKQFIGLRYKPTPSWIWNDAYNNGFLDCSPSWAHVYRHLPSPIQSAITYLLHPTGFDSPCTSVQLFHITDTQLQKYFCHAL